MSNIDSIGRLGMPRLNAVEIHRQGKPAGVQPFSREQKEDAPVDGMRRTIGRRFFHQNNETPRQAGPYARHPALVADPAPNAPNAAAMPNQPPSYQQAVMQDQPPPYHEVVMPAVPPARQDDPVVPPGFQPLGRR